MPRLFTITCIAATILLLPACNSNSNNNNDVTDTSGIKPADTTQHTTDTSGNNEMVTAVDPSDDPTVFIKLDAEAKPLNLVDVKKLIGYPPMAREAEIEGKVLVRVQVSQTGSYIRHVTLKDPNPMLTKAVTDKVSQLIFTPGQLNGQPVKSWVTIPFDFNLAR